MLAMLVWKPHLGTLANSLVILGVMVWMYVMWRRYRKRYTIKKTSLLLAPKLVVTLLVVLALMDPAWRDVKPSDAVGGLPGTGHGRARVYKRRRSENKQ